nr:hypothetical protein [Ensifer sp. IC4062]
MDVNVVSPSRADSLVATEHLAPASHQLAQQVELHLAQMDLLAIAAA